MNITIIRTIDSPFCLGRLYIDGILYCDTLEPPYLSPDDLLIYKDYNIKIGNVAIPYGDYTIDLSIVSPKFKDRSWAKPYNGIVPTILGVKGRSRILIHPGNTASQYGGDSSGCILVGRYDVHTAKIIDSVATYHELMRRLHQSHDVISLCIKGPW